MEKLRNKISMLLRDRKFGAVRQIILKNELMSEAFKLSVEAYLLINEEKKIYEGMEKYKKSLLLCDDELTKTNYALALTNNKNFEEASTYYESLLATSNNQKVYEISLSNLLLIKIITNKIVDIKNIIDSYSGRFSESISRPYKYIYYAFNQPKYIDKLLFEDKNIELIEDILSSINTVNSYLGRGIALKYCEIIYRHYSNIHFLEKFCIISFNEKKYDLTLKVTREIIESGNINANTAKIHFEALFNRSDYKIIKEDIVKLKVKHKELKEIFEEYEVRLYFKQSDYENSRKILLNNYCFNRKNITTIINLATVQAETNRKIKALVSLSLAKKKIYNNNDLEVNRKNKYLELIELTKAGINRDICKFSESEDVYKKLILNDSNNLDAWQRLLFSIGYNSNNDSFMIHKLFSDYSKVLKNKYGIKTIKKYDEIKRKYRLAYVSSDICRSSVSNFLISIIKGHITSNAFDVVIIHTGTRKDNVTEIYKNLGVKIFMAPNASAQALSNFLKSNNIDIAIDCVGVTRNSNPGIFSGEEMPLAVSLFLGHGSTSGNPYIEYAIASRDLIPESEIQYYTERICYTKESFIFPYYFLREKLNITNPFQKNGFLTFGSLSRSVRLNYEVLKTWAVILTKVNDAKLFMASNDILDPFVKKYIMNSFAEFGISQDRILFSEFKTFDALNQIDILLDQFPQNSGTTLIESLLAGVPFVTKVDRMSYGKFGQSILKACEMSDLVAVSTDEYISKVIRLTDEIKSKRFSRNDLSETAFKKLTDANSAVSEIENIYNLIIAKEKTK